MNIRLIVPNANRNVSPIVAYGRTIAEVAGGFTATQSTGGWIDDHGTLLVEPVTVFDCYCDDARAGIQYAQTANRVDAGAFRTLAAQIARELNQDCVYLEIDGKVEFITK